MSLNPFLASRLNSVSQSSIRKIFEEAPENAINMGLGELQLPTPQSITDHIQKILAKGYVPYTPNAGTPELIEAVKHYYSPVQNTDVCVTTGAEEALFTSVLGFVEPGEEVLIPDPGFVAYKSIVQIAGGIPVHYNLKPENGFHLDRYEMIKKITPRTKMIIICNPSNPLGTVLTPEEVDFLLEISDKKKILLLVDEIYREMYLKEKPDTFLGKGKYIQVVSGLSKSHCMTGWRIGWLAAAQEFIQPIIPLHQYICTCAPYISQKAAEFALSYEGERAGEEIRSYLVENYKYIERKLSDELPSLEFIDPAASPYLFLNVKKDEIPIVENLSDSGIISIPGRVFGENGRNWIRVSYGMKLELLKEATDRIISVLRESLQ